MVVVEKLAYLHGWPTLLPEREEIDDETKLVLTLFVGVMLGAKGATDAVAQLSKELSKQVVRRLPSAALTKYAMYNLAKQVAKWVGVSLTKKKFAEWLGRMIPLFGGLVAGVFTWVAFSGGSRRLLEHLESLALAEQ